MPPQPENKALLAVIIWWGWHWGGGAGGTLRFPLPKHLACTLSSPPPCCGKVHFHQSIALERVGCHFCRCHTVAENEGGFLFKDLDRIYLFSPGCWVVGGRSKGSQFSSILENNMEHNTGGLVQMICLLISGWFFFSFQPFIFRVTYILYHLPFFEDDFAIPQVGYVSSLDGIHPGDFTSPASSNNMTPLWKSPRIAPHTPQLGQKCWVSSTQVELK